MRFKKLAWSNYEDTRRKRLAAARSQRREREKFPLLGELIGEQQPDIDQVMNDRAQAWSETCLKYRQRRATDWRRARRDLIEFPDELRRAILNYWNNHRWLPGDPTYLLDLLHSVRMGTIVRHGDTLRYEQICVTRAALEDVEAGCLPETLNKTPFLQLS